MLSSLIRQGISPKEPMLALLSSQLDSASKTTNATLAAFESRRFNNNGTTLEDRA